MATLLEIRRRRAEVAQQRAEIRSQYLELSTADDPDEARMDELRAQETKLAKREADLTTAETMAAEAEEAERRTAGLPIGGTGGGFPAREVRVFGGVATPLPQSFDGETLRAQNGERIPILEARHRLRDFIPASENRASELGLGGFLRALYRGPESELERRVMAEASIGTGGALVPAPLAAEIIDAMTPRGAAFRAGVRRIPMTAPTLRFARVVSEPEGTWRTENSPIQEDQPSLDDLTMRAKTWALLVRVSKELTEDAANLDAQLRNMFASSAALALDRAILTGSGVGPEPKGIIRQGIQIVTPETAFAASPYGAMLDAVEALEIANAGEVTASIMHPSMARRIYGMLDATGNPAVVPVRIAGVPRLVTTSMPATGADAGVILGDFREVFVGMRTQLQISVLTERFAELGEIGFVLWMRADVAVARPSALAFIPTATDA